MAEVIVICGSRGWKSFQIIKERIDKLEEMPEKVIIRVGGARGADEWAEHYSRHIGLEVDRVDAEWNKNGRYNPQAGFERNTRMLDKKPKAKYVIAFWDQYSMGTLDTIEKGLRRDLPVEVFLPSGDCHVFTETKSGLEGLYDLAESKRAKIRLRQGAKKLKRQIR